MMVVLGRGNATHKPPHLSGDVLNKENLALNDNLGSSCGRNAWNLAHWTSETLSRIYKIDVISNVGRLFPSGTRPVGLSVNRSFPHVDVNLYHFCQSRNQHSDIRKVFDY